MTSTEDRERELERSPLDEATLDRKAWNLRNPAKRPQIPQAPSSVRLGREDKTEPESEAA
jgi:hypothetical protein